MRQYGRSGHVTLHRVLVQIFTSPPVFAFVPALCLAAFWFGGEVALMVLAATLPMIYIAGTNLIDPRQNGQTDLRRIMSADAFHQGLEALWSRLTSQSKKSALFLVEIDDFDALIDRYGQTAVEQVTERIGAQIIQAVRQGDTIGKINRNRFAICTAPVIQLDLELCLQMAARLQANIEEPISIDGLVIYVSASVGFCQHAHAPGTDAQDWMQASRLALREARANGPSTVRAYSKQMQSEAVQRREAREDVQQALDQGQFKPWFQPQISTDTGKITGFEALARWHHPQRGTLLPGEFLPSIADAGMHERLAELMMYQSFAALKKWDDAGVSVPQIGVNFAGPELSNPRLVEKIEWELDRFDLTPDRLAVEVLETVVASAPDDMVTRNIIALRDLGCRIDLDDFGTGHASLASIQRFSVNRIKIDRSFVTKADRDPEQQRMISAILTMAERLNVETLAEGVETVGEHVLLAQLGCDHVQGFGIARPMPFDETLKWVANHNAKLTHVPRIMDGKST